MPSPLRTWLNKHQGLVTLMALLLLGGSAWFVTWRYRPKPPGPPGKAYYYDTVAKAYFIDEQSKFSPFTTAEGHAAVRANFFSCGACTDKTTEEGGERFLGYYEKFTDEVAAKMREAGREAQYQAMAQVQAKMLSTDGETWVAAESPEGAAISQAVQAKCGTPAQLRYCVPLSPTPAKVADSAGY